MRAMAARPTSGAWAALLLKWRLVRHAMPCRANPIAVECGTPRFCRACCGGAGCCCGVCPLWALCRSRQAAVERYGQPSSSAVQDRQSESAPCGSVANHAARPLLTRAMRCADAISLRCGPMRCDAVRCGAVRRYTPTAETRAAASQPHLAVSHPPFEARRGPPVVPRGHAAHRATHTNGI
jgi:hypothetical protein